MAEPHVQDFFRSDIPGVELYCEMIIRNKPLKNGKGCRQRMCSLNPPCNSMHTFDPKRRSGHGLDNHN